MRLLNDMNESNQCETLGLHPGPLPSSPLFKRKSNLSGGDADSEPHVKRVRSEDKENSGHMSTEMDTALKTLLKQQPKVIVEAQPPELHSLYELQHEESTNTTTTTTTTTTRSSSSTTNESDSGVSDESSDLDEEEEEEEEEDLVDADDNANEDDEDDDIVHRLNDANPKEGFERAASPNASLHAWPTPFAHYLDGPAPPTPNPVPPSSPMASTVMTSALSSAPRIETCAENGKSYLQLGTMSHHLPVTPVLQPKSNYRPPQPSPTRPHPPASLATLSSSSVSVSSKSETSSCALQRRSCYRAQRTRMLNVSLHKLQMARQSHEACLRRSVLICNLLRRIEDETELEADAVYSNEPEEEDEEDEEEDEEEEDDEEEEEDEETQTVNMVEETTYWTTPVCMSSYNSHLTPPTSPLTTPVPPPPSVTSTAVSAPSANFTDTYETTLKDFHSAFRVTPFSTTPSAASDGGINVVDSLMDDKMGSGDINWSSVLSLSTSSGHNELLVDKMTSPGSPSSDIGWKLSADDVLRVFQHPNANSSVVNSVPTECFVANAASEVA